MVGNRRGAVIVFSFLVVTFLITWATVGFRRSSVELSQATRFATNAQTFHLAEGGLNRGLQYLESSAAPAGTLPFDPFGGAQNLAGGTYTVSIDPDDNNPVAYLDSFTITSAAQLNGATVIRQVSLLLQSSSFARYSYFTNLELGASGNPIWFTGNDTLSGPVHTNGQFSISGSPVFNGAISSVSGSINYKNPPPAGGNNPQFNAGLTLNAGAITMPSTLTGLRTAAGSGGYMYSGDTTIVLQSNGTMLVTNSALGWASQVTTLPANGAIFVDNGEVRVSGTINGQLSIGSEEDAVITSHITYADNPQVNPNSDDILGLASEQNVMIATVTPNDLIVQASILALNESIFVEGYNNGIVKGTLNVYGGLIQKRRGPVGQFNSATGTQTSGFRKSYYYDARFASMAPPFFPTTSNYSTLLWQEE
jgi:hypothetical protein